MSIDCLGIPDVTINGNNYGASLYDLKVDVNFNSSTVFMASFVSEDGTYSISASDLNAETASVLSLGSRQFNIYPVNYKIQSSPSGKLLVVKFIDASHKYLDKHNVVTKDVVGSRFLSVIPVEPEDNGTEVQFGKYTPDELLSKMRGVIPISQKAINMLSSFKREEGAKDANGLTEVTGLYLDTMGSLRDVLNGLGSQIGFTFYWDWSTGGEGQLEVVDSTTYVTAKNFAASFKTSIENLLSSYDESFSIEDNYASTDFVYDTSDTGHGGGRILSKKAFGFKYLDILKDDFWLKPSWTRAYFTKDELNDNNWYKMCAAAMVSQEFFEKYIYWNIAAKAIENFFPFKKKSSDMEEDTSQLKKTDGANPEYNNFVTNCLKDFYDAKLIFYRRKGSSIKGEIEYALNYSALSRAEAMHFLNASTGELRDELVSKFGKKDTPFWYIAINKIDKNPTGGEPAVDNPDPNKSLGGGFQQVLESLYLTCKTFGENFQRHYLSTDKEDRMSRIDGKKYEIELMKKRTHEAYSIQEPWIYETTDSSNTFLRDLVSYRKQPHFSETWTAAMQEQKPAFNEFYEEFRLNVKEAEEIDEDISNPQNQKDEREYDNLEGYVYYDAAPNRIFKPTDDIRMTKINLDQSNLVMDELIIGDKKYETYVINRDSDVENILGSVIKLFGIDEDGKLLVEYIYKTYRRTLDLESMPSSNTGWSWAYKSQNRSLKNAVSNNFSANKVPEVSERYRFDKIKWLDFLTQYKWGGNSNLEPNVSYNFTVEALIQIQSGWVGSGLESYSLSYNGSSGVTTNITIGSRKKQRQSMENQERLIRLAIGSGLGITKSYMPKPSAARGSMSYGMKAFS